MVERAPQPDWPVCQRDACIAVRLGDDGNCLNHTADHAARTRWFDDLKQGRPLDALGSPSTPHSWRPAMDGANRDSLRPTSLKRRSRATIRSACS